LYVIADADGPTIDHDRHDSGFHVGMSAAVSCHRTSQALLEPFDLDAWGSKTRDLDDSIVSQLQAGASAKFNQIEIPRRDILAQLAPLYVEAERLKIFDELFLYKMDLPQIRAGGVFRLIVEMLHVGAAMRVLLYPKPSNQPNRVSLLFTKGMFV
jgi:hypothetical protein